MTGIGHKTVNKLSTDPNETAGFGSAWPLCQSSHNCSGKEPLAYPPILVSGK